MGCFWWCFSDRLSQPWNLCCYCLSLCDPGTGLQMGGREPGWQHVAVDGDRRGRGTGLGGAGATGSRAAESCGCEGPGPRGLGPRGLGLRGLGPQAAGAAGGHRGLEEASPRGGREPGWAATVPAHPMSPRTSGAFRARASPPTLQRPGSAPPSPPKSGVSRPRDQWLVPTQGSHRVQGRPPTPVYVWSSAVAPCPARLTAPVKAKARAGATPPP